MGQQLVSVVRVSLPDVPPNHSFALEGVRVEGE